MFKIWEIILVLCFHLAFKFGCWFFFKQASNSLKLFVQVDMFAYIHAYVHNVCICIFHPV